MLALTSCLPVHEFHNLPAMPSSEGSQDSNGPSFSSRSLCSTELFRLGTINFPKLVWDLVYKVFNAYTKIIGCMFWLRFGYWS